MQDYTELYDLIITTIVTNHNNEITANILRPILVDLLDYTENKIGDLDGLNTTDKSSVVAAINELRELINNLQDGIEVFEGNDNPNVTPPASPSVGDMYNQTTVLGDPIALYIYNGTTWIKIGAPTFQEVIDNSIAAGSPINVSMLNNDGDGTNPFVTLPEAEVAIDALNLTSNQALAEIYLVNGDGDVISTLNVGFLNNEGTTFFYNEDTGNLELRDDEGNVLSVIPVSSFISNVVNNAAWNPTLPYVLDFKDSEGNIVFSVSYAISNIQGLQAALDGKLSIVIGGTALDYYKGDGTLGNFTNNVRVSTIGSNNGSSTPITDSSTVRQAIWSLDIYKADKTKTLTSNGTNIPSAANLNSYTATGIYFQPSMSNATSGTNYPTPQAGTLEVIAQSDVSGGVIIHQRYSISGGSLNDVYYRNYNGTTWTSWVSTNTDVVHKGGNETITGQKTFTSLPVFNLGVMSGSAANGGLHFALPPQYSLSNGYLVTTNIVSSTADRMFELYITGNSYGTPSTRIPFNVIVQGFQSAAGTGVVNASAVSLGQYIPEVRIFYNGGFVCFWIAPIAGNPTLRFSLGTNIGSNQITGIGNNVYPSGTATNLVTVVPVRGLNTNDFSDANITALNSLVINAFRHYPTEGAGVTIDCNTQIDGLRGGSTWANAPISSGIGILETLVYSNDWKVQTFYRIDAVSGQPILYRREYYSGTTWGSWIREWRTTDFGMGAGAVGTSNFDTLIQTGFYKSASGSTTGAPVTEADVNLIHIEDTVNASQFATQTNNSGVWYRRRLSGGWLSWVKLLTNSDITTTDISNWNSGYKRGGNAYGANSDIGLTDASFIFRILQNNTARITFTDTETTFNQVGTFNQTMTFAQHLRVQASTSIGVNGGSQFSVGNNLSGYIFSSQAATTAIPYTFNAQSSITVNHTEWKKNGVLMAGLRQNGVLFAKEAGSDPLDVLTNTNIRWGKSTIALNGILTTFNIPHGMSSVPSSFSLTFSDGANTDFIQSNRSIDATNITIECGTAPATGSITVYWQVFK